MNSKEQFKSDYNSHKRCYIDSLLKEPGYWTRGPISFIFYTIRLFLNGFIIVPSTVVVLLPFIIYEFNLSQLLIDLRDWLNAISISTGEKFDSLINIWMLTGIFYCMTIYAFNPWRSPNKRSIESHMDKWILEQDIQKFITVTQEEHLRPHSQT